MTLKEYIENLNKFAAENPETLEMQVITSKDDEGNGFNRVNYEPSKGFFSDGDYVQSENYDDDYSQSDTNAVCVN